MESPESINQQSELLTKFRELIDPENHGLLISSEEIKGLSEVIDGTKESTVITIDPKQLSTKSVLLALSEIGLFATAKTVKNQELREIFISKSEKTLSQLID